MITIHNKKAIFVLLLTIFAQTQAFSMLRNESNRQLEAKAKTNQAVIDNATKFIPDLVKSSFDYWKNQNGKTYSSDAEEIYRIKVFYSNFQKLSKMNDANRHYRRDLNQFADLTPEEFRLHRLGVNNIDAQYQFNELMAQGAVASDRTLSADSIPESVDWRNHGAVTEVKDQGDCGSCWAFSATGALESLYKIQGHDLQGFSEQHLMDCSVSYGNNSCNGGLMYYAFKYTTDEGIATSASYPYQEKDQSCQAFTPEFKTTGQRLVTQYSVEAMKAAVAQQPVTVGIAGDSIATYGSGIFDDKDCGTDLNHGVLIVGYGSEDGVEYWIVKNTWGPNWGEDGYIRMAIDYDHDGANGNNGMCGILMLGIYPEM